jgi:hypothetical protein
VGVGGKVRETAIYPKVTPQCPRLRHAEVHAGYCWPK